MNRIPKHISSDGNPNALNSVLKATLTFKCFPCTCTHAALKRALNNERKLRQQHAQPALYKLAILSVGCRHGGTRDARAGNLQYITSATKRMANEPIKEEVTASNCASLVQRRHNARSSNIIMRVHVNKDGVHFLFLNISFSLASFHLRFLSLSLCLTVSF